jgi:hypothetical protein
MDQQVAADEQATQTLPAVSRSGGRRYHSGHRPPPARRPAVPWSMSAEGRPTGEVAPLPDRTASAGTLAGLLAVFLAGCLLAAWLHQDVVAGLGFCAGTCVAAGYARPAALLGVVVSVPVVFLAAEIVAQLATVPGGAHRSTPVLVAEGTLLTLAGVAPWLFAGTIAGLVIAMFRGLPQSVRDLRAGLTGRRARTRRPARRDPWAS